MEGLDINQFRGKQFYEQMGCSSNQWWAGYQMGRANCGGASCQFLENKLTNEWGVALNSGGAGY